MKLFFDTETTGLVNWKLPDTHPTQPALVQFGCILTDDDGNIRRTLGFILRRIGIPEQASNKHGITDDIANAYGLELNDHAIWKLSDMFHNATELIAHNYKFDKTVMNKFFEGICKLDDSKSFCTMEATTDLLKLPGSYGKYKWPKLSEAYEFLFNKPLIGAHDALTDTRACMDIYFELKKREVTA